MRRAPRQLVPGVVSQGVSSATNLVVVLMLARTQSAAVVGAWSLLFAISTISTTLTRAAFSTPLLLAPKSSITQTSVKGGVACSALLGAMVGVVMTVLGSLGVAPLSLAITFSLGMPLVLTQDFIRYSWFARGRSSMALLLDSTWFVVQAGGFAIASVVGALNPTWITASWCAGAAVAVCLARVTGTQWAFRPGAARGFLTQYGWQSKRLIQESAATAIAANGLAFLVPATVSYASAGALRVAQSLFAPMSTLIAGLTPVVLRELTTRMVDGRPYARIIRVWLGGLMAIGLVYGAVLVLLPTSIGEALIGRSWAIVTPLLLPLAIQGLLRPVISVQTMTLRAKLRLSSLRTVSWLLVAPSLLLPILSARVWGLEGLGWGIVSVSVLSALIWRVTSRRHPDEGGRPEDTSPPTE